MITRHRMMSRDRMKRRNFLFVAGTALWPGFARAQSGRVRRIGILLATTEDVEGRRRVAGFLEGMQALGWRDGGNLQVDLRWGSGDRARTDVLAKDMVALKPEVILAGSSPATAALKQATAAIPIVFAGVSDPVGDGFVAGLQNPGGNVTGFASYQPEIGGKWLQLLKELAPRLSRVALLYNPRTAPGGGTYFLRPFFEMSARTFAVTPIAAPVGDLAGIEAALADLAREPNSGLVVMPDVFNNLHSAAIVKLAAQHSLPAIYPLRYFAEGGGLVAYGVDFNALYRQSAVYVDKILKGAKPAELPVQQPTSFELVINVKTAKALGLTVPPSILVQADAVIE